MDFINVTWEKIVPNYPLRYSFLDEDLKKIYQTEADFSFLMEMFSCIALLTACLGLFGLATYAAEQRTKEIGIRKVLGASKMNIILLVSRNFLSLVFLASLIAWPIAYYLTDKWLQDFAYRIEMSVGVFLLVSAAAIAITLATVGIQAWKASSANPVDALRYE